MHQVTLKTAPNRRKRWLFYTQHYHEVFSHHFLYLLRDTFQEATKISCNPQYGSYINPVPVLLSHNSATVNSVGVNTKNKKKTGENRKKQENRTLSCWCMHDLAKQISTPRYVILIDIYIYISCEGNGLRPTYFTFQVKGLHYPYSKHTNVYLI